jgi:AcrR family transcriptional regulator
MAESVKPESPSPGRGGSPRREAIFDAALRLFRERGFHGTSINEIGAASGVTGPAIYRHFDGKAEVLAEAIREGTRRIAAATRPALAAEHLEPGEALESLVRSYVEVALDNADIYAAYVLELRHLDDALRKPLRRSLRVHREDWKRLVQAVRPDLEDEQARTLVKMATLSVTSLCLEPSRLDREALVDFASERVMALLLAPAPPA